MSVIYCHRTGEYIDTDFNVEHYDECPSCGGETIDCHYCGSPLKNNGDALMHDKCYKLWTIVRANYASKER